MKLKDIRNKKFDVILVFGQSNAEGQGQGNEELIPKVDNSVLYLTNKKSVNFVFKYGKNKEVISTKFKCPKINPICVAPMNYFLDGTPRPGSFAGEFCNLYKEKYLQKDREILVVMSAVGGTGFADNRWTENGILNKRFFKMVDKAVSLNKENRIACALFHQGERDSIDHDRMGETRYNFYSTEIIKLINKMRSRYSEFTIPFLSGEFVDEWCETGEDAVEPDIIEKALHDLEKKLPLCRCISSKGLKSNNQEIHNGDNIHFSRKSCIELGKRYFKAYEELTK